MDIKKLPSGNIGDFRGPLRSFSRSIANISQFRGLQGPSRSTIPFSGLQGFSRSGRHPVLGEWVGALVRFNVFMRNNVTVDLTVSLIFCFCVYLDCYCVRLCLCLTDICLKLLIRLITDDPGDSVRNVWISTIGFFSFIIHSFFIRNFIRNWGRV